MTRLYLIGTVHWDLKGPERLKKLLARINPDQICLENSPENIAEILLTRMSFKHTEPKRLFQTINEEYNLLINENELDKAESVLRFLSVLGFEAWASYDYKKYNPNLTIIPLQNQVLVQRGHEFYKEALGLERIAGDGSFTNQFVNELIETDLIEFQKYIDNGYNEYSFCEEEKTLIPHIIECDTFMEQNLRKALLQNQGITAFICGNTHFYGDYSKNLYERVSDLSPKRIKLSEMD